jgi:hypothetical protein
MRRGRIRDLDIEPARYVNMVLGTWILISAYLWPHTGGQFMITIFAGAVVALLAPFEVGYRWVRRINLAMGGLLVLTALTLPRMSMATLWHNVIAGIALVLVSFFGPPHGIVPPRPVAPDDAYEGIGGV